MPKGKALSPDDKGLIGVAYAACGGNYKRAVEWLAKRGVKVNYDYLRQIIKKDADLSEMADKLLTEARESNAFQLFENVTTNEFQRYNESVVPLMSSIYDRMLQLVPKMKTPKQQLIALEMILNAIRRDGYQLNQIYLKIRDGLHPKPDPAPLIGDVIKNDIRFGGLKPPAEYAKEYEAVAAIERQIKDGTIRNRVAPQVGDQESR